MSNEQNFEKYPSVWIPWREYTDAQKKQLYIDDMRFELEEIQFYKERVGKGSEKSQWLIWNILEMCYHRYKYYKYVLENFSRYKHFEYQSEVDKKAKEDFGWDKTIFERKYEDIDTGVHNDKAS